MNQMCSFSTDFPISNCTEIHAMESAVIHAERRTDRTTDGHDEAHRSYCANAPKKETDKACYDGMMMLTENNVWTRGSVVVG